MSNANNNNEKDARMSNATTEIYARFAAWKAQDTKTQDNTKTQATVKLLRAIYTPTTKAGN